MKNLPKMISSKDLMYICDSFNWHLLAAKKFEQYVPQVVDSDCEQKLNNLIEMHYQVCHDLIALLEGGCK